MGTEASNDPVHDLIRGLQDPAAFPHAVQDLQVIETHISWVISTCPISLHWEGGLIRLEKGTDSFYFL